MIAILWVRLLWCCVDFGVLRRPWCLIKLIVLLWDLICFGVCLLVSGLCCWTACLVVYVGCGLWFCCGFNGGSFVIRISVCGDCFAWMYCGCGFLGRFLV